MTEYSSAFQENAFILMFLGNYSRDKFLSPYLTGEWTWPRRLVASIIKGTRSVFCFLPPPPPPPHFSFILGFFLRCSHKYRSPPLSPFFRGCVHRFCLRFSISSLFFFLVWNQMRQSFLCWGAAGWRPSGLYSLHQSFVTVIATKLHWSVFDCPLLWTLFPCSAQFDSHLWNKWQI